MDSMGELPNICDPLALKVDDCLGSRLWSAMRVEKVEFMSRPPLHPNLTKRSFKTREPITKGRSTRKNKHQSTDIHLPRLSTQRISVSSRKSNIPLLKGDTHTNDNNRPISAVSSVSMSNWQRGSMSSGFMSPSSPLMTHSSNRNPPDTVSPLKNTTNTLIPTQGEQKTCIDNRKYEHCLEDELQSSQSSLVVGTNDRHVTDAFSCSRGQQEPFVRQLPESFFNSKWPFRHFEKTIAPKVNSGAVKRVPKKEKKEEETKKLPTTWHSRNELLPDNTQEGCVLYCAESCGKIFESKEMSITQNTPLQQLASSAEPYRKKCDESMVQEKNTLTIATEDQTMNGLCTYPCKSKSSNEQIVSKQSDSTETDNIHERDNMNVIPPGLTNDVRLLSSNYGRESFSCLNNQFENPFNSTYNPDQQAYLSLSSGLSTPEKKYSEHEYKSTDPKASSQPSSSSIKIKDPQPAAIDSKVSLNPALVKFATNDSIQEHFFQTAKSIDRTQNQDENEGDRSNGNEPREDTVHLNVMPTRLDSASNHNAFSPPAKYYQISNEKTSHYTNGSKYNYLLQKGVSLKHDFKRHETYEDNYFRNTVKEIPCWRFDFEYSKTKSQKTRQTGNNKKKMRVSPKKKEFRPSVNYLNDLFLCDNAEYSTVGEDILNTLEYPNHLPQSAIVGDRQNNQMQQPNTTKKDLRDSLDTYHTTTGISAIDNCLEESGSPMCVQGKKMKVGGKLAIDNPNLTIFQIQSDLGCHHWVSDVKKQVVLCKKCKSDLFGQRMSRVKQVTDLRKTNINDNKKIVSSKCIHGRREHCKICIKVLSWIERNENPHRVENRYFYVD